ncbi:MAG: hypothetical protein ACE5D2_06515, partial [Fidelibacterota bacterium]
MRTILNKIWPVIVGLGLLLFFSSCEVPESLKPVSGIEGIVEYQGAWPDSIKATALIVLTGL